MRVRAGVLRAAERLCAGVFFFERSGWKVTGGLDKMEAARWRRRRCPGLIRTMANTPRPDPRAWERPSPNTAGFLPQKLHQVVRFAKYKFAETLRRLNWAEISAAVARRFTAKLGRLKPLQIRLKTTSRRYKMSIRSFF